PHPYGPCPCGSGKKYKFCHHQDRSTSGYWTFSDNEGLILGPARVEAMPALAEDVPIPKWLLQLAQGAAKAAAKPDAGHYHGLQALLMTAMASEALVNRLLEPLVDSKKWSGSKGIERKGTPEKWQILGDKL